MIRLGLAGLGKMGLSHLAIVNAHPDLEVAAVCDGLKYVTSNLEKLTGIKAYPDFEEMLSRESLDAVLIATPSRTHAPMAALALDRNLHIFCEKPFVLDISAGAELVEKSQASGLVTQVGYHNRFVGAFQEARRLVQAGALGNIHHFFVEAYGPVVVRPQGSTWRAHKKEGGGVVFDYACHAIDLVNFTLGAIAEVSGVVRNSIFSRDVDDEVYSSIMLESGISGQLAANWSDESQRKMTTKLSIWGTNGHIKVDRQECAVYLRDDHAESATPAGWKVVNTTELTSEVWYYLRGEEYSAQIDEFAQRISGKQETLAATFQDALATDRTVASLNGEIPERLGASHPPSSWMSRLKLAIGK